MKLEVCLVVKINIVINIKGLLKRYVCTYSEREKDRLRESKQGQYFHIVLSSYLSAISTNNQIEKSIS